MKKLRQMLKPRNTNNEEVKINNPGRPLCLLSCQSQYYTCCFKHYCILSTLKYLSIILSAAFPSFAVVKLPDVRLRSGGGNMTKYWRSGDKNDLHSAWTQALAFWQRRNERKFQNNYGAAIAVHSWSLVGFLWCMCPMIKRGGSFLSAFPVRDYTAGFLCDTYKAQSSITTATAGLKKQSFLSPFLWFP